MPGSGCADRTGSTCRSTTAPAVVASSPGFHRGASSAAGGRRASGHAEAPRRVCSMPPRRPRPRRAVAAQPGKWAGRGGGGPAVALRRPRLVRAVERVRHQAAVEEWAAPVRRVDAVGLLDARPQHRIGAARHNSFRQQRLLFRHHEPAVAACEVRGDGVRARAATVVGERRIGSGRWARPAEEGDHQYRGRGPRHARRGVAGARASQLEDDQVEWPRHPGGQAVAPALQAGGGLRRVPQPVLRVRPRSVEPLDWPAQIAVPGRRLPPGVGAGGAAAVRAVLEERGGAATEHCGDRRTERERSQRLATVQSPLEEPRPADVAAARRMCVGEVVEEQATREDSLGRVGGGRRR
eukprot:scaffold104164_cov69-Phaeocystis_antarctica.AAC.4